MTLKYPADLDPRMIAFFTEAGADHLAARMGIEFLELSAERSVARMPVAGNLQLTGILHGGAHVVLGETLGSSSAAIHAGVGHYVVGIEINASHSGAISEGFVIGTCTAISLGRTLATHEIIMTDEASGKLLSTVRMTNLVREQR